MTFMQLSIAALVISWLLILVGIGLLGRIGSVHGALKELPLAIAAICTLAFYGAAIKQKLPVIPLGLFEFKKSRVRWGMLTAAFVFSIFSIMTYECVLVGLREAGTVGVPDRFGGIDRSILTALLTIGGTVFLAPLYEELLFRGLLLPALQEKFGTWAAIIVTAFIFSVAHLRSFTWIGLFLMGVLLAIVAVRSRLLWPAMLFHSLNNLQIIVCAHFHLTSVEIGARYELSRYTTEFTIATAVLFGCAAYAAWHVCEE